VIFGVIVDAGNWGAAGSTRSSPSSELLAALGEGFTDPVDDQGFSRFVIADRDFSWSSTDPAHPRNC